MQVGVYGGGSQRLRFGYYLLLAWGCVGLANCHNFFLSLSAFLFSSFSGVSGITSSSDPIPHPYPQQSHALASSPLFRGLLAAFAQCGWNRLCHARPKLASPTSGVGPRVFLDGCRVGTAPAAVDGGRGWGFTSERAGGGVLIFIFGEKGGGLGFGWGGWVDEMGRGVGLTVDNTQCTFQICLV